MKFSERPSRHLGTYYYVGSLAAPITCGHRHATVRTAMPCLKKWQRTMKFPRVFQAHLGLLPGKPLS